VANFGALSNRLLWRLRQRGVSFGNQPTNGVADALPPQAIQDLLNEGYAEFISQTLEAQLATLKLGFLTVAGPVAGTTIGTRYPLAPMPVAAIGGAVQPCVEWIYEGTYTTQTGGQNAGYEYEFELTGQDRFKYYAGDYTRRLSWFGPRVIYAARLFKSNFLEVLPGTATAGDLIQLTVAPDVVATGTTVPCAGGGIMTALTDIPLIPAAFHNALVEYGVMNAGDAFDKGGQVQRAADKWDAYIAKALWRGAIEDGGYPSTVVDVWDSHIALGANL
jgi:hypothetical protein